MKELCALRCVSGREDAVREYIIDKIKDFAEYEVDPPGNLLVYKKGEKRAKNRVMIDAHADEVGFIVTCVDSDGFLRFSKVGGIDSRVVVGKEVLVGDGPINGAVGIKPVHLLKKGEEKTVPRDDELYIDIGAKSREEALQAVKIGDSVCLAGDFVEFGDGFIKARALDDRAGCAVLLEMIRNKVEYDLSFSFSVQEEVGARGAQTAAYSLRPDYAIVVETTTAADVYGVEEEKRVCLCSGGAAVSFMDKSSVYDRELYEKAFETAKKKGIKCQPKTYVYGGNDAGVIHRSRGGVKTLTISTPCRYIHSPSCVMKYSDLEETLKLTRATAEEFAKW